MLYVELHYILSRSGILVIFWVYAEVETFKLLRSSCSTNLVMCKDFSDLKTFSFYLLCHFIIMLYLVFPFL